MVVSATNVVPIHAAVGSQGGYFMRLPKRISRADRDGIAVILLDNIDKSMNVVDDALIEQLDDHVKSIAADPSLVAAVIGSAKAGSFGAGADVRWLPELAARPDVEEYLLGLHTLMYEIVNSPKPYVAAVNGAALGGALELALATEVIVAAPDAQLGLPESSLGLIPGGAGTQLIRRFLPTQHSLELMLSAKPIGAEEALGCGLVASIAPFGTLLDAAVQAARELTTSKVRRASSVDERGEAKAAVELVRSSKLGRSGDAAQLILQVTSIGIDEGPVAGCAAERAAFVKALNSRDSRALRHLFLAEGDIKRRSRGNGEPIQTLGIVGAGQMGSGIAATAASRKIEVRLRDIDDKKLTEAATYLEKVMSRNGADGAMATEAKGRLHTTQAWTGFEECDAIIEAVFELPDLKHETLATICETVSSTALVATNTSAIPIHSLASAVIKPERFLGTHFFSPVDRMPFVELVPHHGTSPETINRAAMLAIQMGKTHIVVGDRPGFFTSRVYARWLIEGIQLLLDGASVSEIDSGAVTAGFPVGPLQAFDEVTLDLVMKASITQVAEKVMAERIDVAAIRGGLQLLIDSGVLGRRHGNGFYRYFEGKRESPNEDVLNILGITPSSLKRETISERLVLAFSTESFLCWDDGTLCHPDDGDVASVRAIGFPRNLGGPFNWADELGASDVLSLCKRYGTRAFTSSSTLEELAHSGGLFQTQIRREVPMKAGEPREVVS